jgi:thiol-disulfide isomerase/thioredoxin
MNQIVKSTIFTLAIVLTMCLSPAYGQKKKIVYLDTLGNKTDITSHLSIINTGRYKWVWDESDEKIRYINWEKTTEKEFNSLLNRYKERSFLPEIIGSKFHLQQFTDVNGKVYSESDLEGKVIVINFWFVGCGPCEVEMPELNALYNKYKDNSDIVFLSFAKSSQSKVLRFLEKKTFNYPVISMTDEHSKEFGIRYYPTNYVYDRSGTCHFASQSIGAGGVYLLEKGVETAVSK